MNVMVLCVHCVVGWRRKRRWRTRGWRSRKTKVCCPWDFCLLFASSDLTVEESILSVTWAPQPIRTSRNIPCENPEQWLPCFPCKLKHSNTVKDWLHPNKALKVSSGTHSLMARYLVQSNKASYKHLNAESRFQTIMHSTSLHSSGIAQSVECQTEKWGIILTWVRSPSAARFFSSGVNFQVRLKDVHTPHQQHLVCTLKILNTDTYFCLSSTVTALTDLLNTLHVFFRGQLWFRRGGKEGKQQIVKRRWWRQQRLRFCWTHR